MSFISSVLRSQGKAAKSAAARVASVTPDKASFWSSPPVQKDEASRKETITTTSIVKTVAEKHDLTHAESRRIINTVFDTIVEAVSDGKHVSFAKFGSFETYKSKGYVGRNPSTGESLLVPEKERIRFRPFTEFKKLVQK